MGEKMVGLTARMMVIHSVEKKAQTTECHLVVMMVRCWDPKTALTTVDDLQTELEKVSRCGPA